MWVNEYLLETLIREQRAEAEQCAARAHLLRELRRARPSRGVAALFSWRPRRRPRAEAAVADATT